MSGLEVLAVVACVAGVISAYRDGGELVRTLKERRRARRALPPSRLLEQSLEMAPQDIEASNRRGIDRFGELFQHGDQIAIDHLKDIHITLLNNLLNDLTTACRDDTFSDFRSLVDASDLGRVQTVKVLSELFMRTLQATQIRDLAIAELNQPIASETRIQELPDKEPVARVVSRSQEEPRRSSRWNLFRRRPSDLSPGQSAPAQATIVPPPLRRASVASPSFEAPVDIGTISGMTGMSGTMGMTSVPEHGGADAHDWALLDNPWVDEDEASLEEQNAQTVRGSMSSIQHTPSPVEQPPAVWSTQSVDPSVQNSFDYSVSAAESLRSATTSTAGSSLLRLPTAENNYLGFCKGAVKLQGRMDSDAMKVSFDIRYMQSRVEFLQCSHCAFAGRVSRSRVWEENARGVRFRWTFLAKSHVPQSKATKESYTYQCQFCAFQFPASAVIQGTDAFLEHIASHRGEPLTHAMLDRTRCVNDCFAEEQSEDWDINLLPLHHPSPTYQMATSPNTGSKRPQESYSPSYFPKYENLSFRRRSSTQAKRSSGLSPG